MMIMLLADHGGNELIEGFEGQGIMREGANTLRNSRLS
jgi:hypothetical protein